MFDIYWGDIELTTLTLFVCVIVLLPLQLLLCFKAKSLFVRLSPILALSALGVLLLVLQSASPGWEGLADVFLALFCGMMILACAVGWGIWALAAGMKKRKNPR